MKDKKYILVSGFRRLSACKKLGWETIPAYIQEENRLIDCPISAIQEIGNSRRQSLDTDEEFIELMSSIKQHGLQLPINIMDIDTKTTNQQFIIKNVIENIHRKDLTPLELATTIIELEKNGLNLGQISVVLSMSPSKVKNMKNLTSRIPKERIKDMRFFDNRLNKGGRLGVSMANRISHLRLSSENTAKLLDYAEKNEYSLGDIEIISRLIGAGMDMEKAITKKDKYERVHANIIIKKEYAPKNMSRTRYINLMLKGKLPLNPKAFYYKDKKSKAEKEDEDD